MYDWFNKTPDALNNGEHFPQLDYAVSLIGASIEDYCSYYKRAAIAVNSSHFLLKILNGVPLSLDRDILDFHYTSRSFGMEIANAMGLTTETNYGKVFGPGILYGKNINELIIAYSDDFDFDAIESGVVDWRSLCPLEVLSHPFSDLSLGRVNGKYPSSARGTAVFKLDVGILLHQYRRWFQTEKYAYEAAGTTQQFLSKYVITNVIWSHMNIVLFNRLFNITFNEQSETVKPIHPFYIVDNTTVLDNGLKRLAESFKRRNRTWDEIIEAIPAFNDTNIRDTLRLPATASTQQITWAFVIARLPLIHNLVHLNSMTKNARNSRYMRSLRTFITSIKSDRLIDRRMPRDMKLEVDDLLFRDITPLLA